MKLIKEDIKKLSTHEIFDNLHTLIYKIKKDFKFLDIDKDIDLIIKNEIDNLKNNIESIDNKYEDYLIKKLTLR